MIELMVVIAIVGILAAIGIPNYAEYVQRGRIIDATSRLADHRVRMEQFFLDNRTYANGGNCGVPVVQTGQEPFNMVCALGAGNTYTVTATGRASHSMTAFEYSINQLGTKTTVKTKWGGTVNGCWVIRGNGSCI
jgi:type IV pilus assembly protein PilE